MNKFPLVSVIMNCYNGEKFLSSSIESILNQSYKKWEVIFLDNNSKDKSEKIFKSYNDKRLKYFKSSKKINLYAARNLALKRTKGELITFLDVDDLWDREKLKRQIKKMTQENTSFLYSNYYILHNNKKKIAFKKNLPSGYISKRLFEYYFIGILTVMFKKDLLKKYKLSFNGTYKIIGDFDLFTRMSVKTSFTYLDKPVATYRKHGQNFSRKNTQLYIKELSHWYKKNKKKYSKHNFQKFLLEIKYLEIKSDIFNNKYTSAFKKFNKFPLSMQKIKLFLLFFLSKKNFSF